MKIEQMDIILQGSYGPPEGPPNLLKRLMNVAKAAQDILDTGNFIHNDNSIRALETALEALENED